jgi:hypothetical protein
MLLALTVSRHISDFREEVDWIRVFCATLQLCLVINFPLVDFISFCNKRSGIFFFIVLTIEATPKTCAHEK